MQWHGLPAKPIRSAYRALYGVWSFFDQFDKQGKMCMTVKSINYTHEVNSIIKSCKYSDALSLDAVAYHIGVSASTLRRKLSAEGTSFMEIKDSHYKSAAIHYIKRTKKSNLEIAENLGFDHTESFWRSFKRWTGVTPNEYRKMLNVK